MVITAIIILIFAILILLLSRKDRFLLMFGIQAFCVVIMIFTCILMVAKLANYHSPLTADFMLYLQLYKLNISLNNIIMLYNVACVVFMCVCYMQFQFFYKGFDAKRWICIIPALITFIINSPNLRYRVFIRFPDITRVFSYLLIYRIFYILTVLITLTYCALPIITLLNGYKKTKIRANKRRKLSLFVGLATVILFFVFDFVIGANSFMYFISTIYFPDNIPNWNTYIYTPVILVVILTGYIFVVYRYNSIFMPFKKKVTYTNDADSIKMLFHNYKNAFFIIERLSKQIMNSFSEKPDAAARDVATIEEIAQDNSTAIAKIIESFKSDFLFNPNKVNLTDCVRKAVLKSNIPNNINITENYENEDITIYGNEVALCDAIVNVINNAADSLSSCMNGKNICISVYSEQALSCVDICDNGKGISKKDAKKIFSPFYSTKHGGKNNGIGLTYTKKIITEHQGSIDFKSIPEQYTSFQIVLPICKKKTR